MRVRTLVVGAGAVGGYFGGRLLELGRDVTFLVRPQRAAQLAAAGLSIRSRHGDVTIPAPPTVTADEVRGTYDLVLLSCKAYDLESAVASLAPAVGPGTAVLPLLNGMHHLDLLDRRFGAARVLGGFCLISSTVDGQGRILHLNELHTVVFGERHGDTAPLAGRVATAFEGVRVDARRSPAVLHEMWEKWVFIAALAGSTCLLRAPIGDLVAADAGELAIRLLDECAAVAAAEGFAPGAPALARSRAMLSAPGSLLAASMLRDIERRAPTEGGHILGDLLRRARARSLPTPILDAAAAHLRTYEARRSREVVA